MSDSRVTSQIAWQHQRAQSRGIASDFTADDWLNVLSSCGGQCFYCRRHVGTQALVIDHRIAISRGGTNTKDNVVAACARCNHRKGPRDRPDVERIEVERIDSDELHVMLGAHRIRMFDYEVDRLIVKLQAARNTRSDTVSDTRPEATPEIASNHKPNAASGSDT